MNTTLPHPAATLPAPSPLRQLLPGVALSGALAAAGMALGRIAWLQEHGFSPLTLAILLGMLIGNTVYLQFAGASGAGVDFCRQTLLRTGVVLYGLRLTVQDIGHVGMAGVLVDALVLGSTFLLACHIGSRWLGLDRNTTVLIGAGSSICGAAAVMATEPVLKARPEQVTVAVASVVVFGTLAMFLYPLLFTLNQHWQLVPGGAPGFGVYTGSTIHEVAQVVAAARAIDPSVADTAIIAKMVRVMMLAPFLLALSDWQARGNSAPQQHGHQPPTKLAVPWFAFGFVAMVLFNSLQLLPRPALSLATELDTGLLATAMAALGISTQLGAIRRAGARPLLLALVLFVWLVLGGALINRWVGMLMG